MTFPANPVKLPDCQMNWESLAKTLGGVKSLGALKRVHGPFDAGVASSVASTGEATLTVTHNLNIQGIQIVTGTLYDGFFAAGFGWRSAVSANSFQIVVHNLTAITASAGWRGVIFEF